LKQELQYSSQNSTLQFYKNVIFLYWILSHPFLTSRKMETHLHIDPLEIKTLQKEYSKDPYFSNIMEELSKWESFKGFHLSSDQLILFQGSLGRNRLCIPKSMTSDIMDKTHNSIMGTAHAGFERSYACIANSFYWPGMTRDIHTYVTTCPTCQQIKHAQHLPYGLLQPIPIPSQPFKMVTMDFIGELPSSKNYNTIFILVCKLTKFTSLFHAPLILRKNRLQECSLIKL